MWRHGKNSSTSATFAINPQTRLMSEGYRSEKMLMPHITASSYRKATYPHYSASQFRQLLLSPKSSFPAHAVSRHFNLFPSLSPKQPLLTKEPQVLWRPAYRPNTTSSTFFFYDVTTVVILPLCEVIKSFLVSYCITQYIS